MFPWSIVFWCAVVVSVAWCGYLYVAIGVGAFYHPMSALGDVLFSLRQWSIVAPILTAIVMGGLWFRRGPLAASTYLIGLSVLVKSALLPLSPPLDSGYRHVYWLDEDKYEIPWRYGPYNGSTGPGGKYFLVNVSVPDLVPRYETQARTIIIGKSVDFNYGKGGAAPEDVCTTSRSLLMCEWQRGNSVFRASGEANLFPPEIPSFLVSVAELLDSFEVPTP